MVCRPRPSWLSRCLRCRPWFSRPRDHHLAIRQPAVQLTGVRLDAARAALRATLALLARSTQVVNARPTTAAGGVCYCDVSAGGLWRPVADFGGDLRNGRYGRGLAGTRRAGLGAREANGGCAASLRVFLRRVVADRSTYPRLRRRRDSARLRWGCCGRRSCCRTGSSRPSPRRVSRRPRANGRIFGGEISGRWRRHGCCSCSCSRTHYSMSYAVGWADQEAIADAEAAGSSGGSRTRKLSSAGRAGLEPLFRLLARVDSAGRRCSASGSRCFLDAGFRVEPVCPRGWTVAVRASAAALVIGLSVLASTEVARTALSSLVPVTPPAVPIRTPQPRAPSPARPTRPRRMAGVLQVERCRLCLGREMRPDIPTVILFDHLYVDS